MSHRHSQVPKRASVPGATFIPGADDYDMPGPIHGLYSPAPQRFTPEVPLNIQESLTRMENAGQLPQTPNTQMSNSLTASPSSGITYGAKAGASPFRASYLHHSAQPQLPSFSPFPKLKNRLEHVPPSDEEKEAILYSSMNKVNSSQDAEMQLDWAEDTLIYVDTMHSQELRLAAIQKRPPATPSIEKSLRDNAVNIIEFLAKQYHPKALFMTGMWYEFGKFGCRTDKHKASQLYLQAAEKYPRAHYRLGLLFEQTKDKEKALEHYEAGFRAGDSASTFRLGMMALLEDNNPSSVARGLEHLKKAAQNVDVNAPQAAYVLGMIQARELPQVTIPESVEHLLPYDLNAARLNIEKSAFLGLAKAQLKMGSAYELCSLGCEFDPALSLHYNALAAGQGESEAEMSISKWFICGHEGVFPRNEEFAYNFAERAAQEQFPTAEFALGYFHEIGIHVAVNLDKAVEWYEKAAAQDNEDAVARLKQIHQNRESLPSAHKEVAIKQIQSRYGSQRGARPARFQNQPPNRLAPVEDEDGAYSPGSGENVPYPTNGSRHSSRLSYGGTPYPTGASSSSMPIRRPSNAPYPNADGPTPQVALPSESQPYHHQAGFPPRASSTAAQNSQNGFSIIPGNMRSSSTGPPAMSYSYGVGQAPYQNGAGPNAPQGRPGFPSYSGSIGHGAGLGGYGYGGPGPNGLGRPGPGPGHGPGHGPGPAQPGSGPASAGGSIGHGGRPQQGWGSPQNGHGPGLGGPAHNLNPSHQFSGGQGKKPGPAAPVQKPTAAASASNSEDALPHAMTPSEYSALMSKKEPGRVPSQGSGVGGRPFQGPGAGQPVVPPKQGGWGGQGAYQQNQGQYQGHHQQQQQPQQQVLQPQNPQQYQQQQPAPQQPPKQPAQQPAQQPQKPAAASGAKPNGPSTFAEMGIPVAKEREDCVVM